MVGGDLDHHVGTVAARGRIFADGGDALQILTHGVLDPLGTAAGTSIDTRVVLFSASLSP
jgi:hypothetical protein